MEWGEKWDGADRETPQIPWRWIEYGSMFCTKTGESQGLENLQKEAVEKWSLQSFRKSFYILNVLFSSSSNYQSNVILK